jgi:hypothetical protein
VTNRNAGRGGGRRSIDRRAVPIRHVQITHDQVVGLLRESLKRGAAALDALDGVAGVLQRHLDQLAHDRLVVHDQHPGHASSLLTSPQNTAL